MALTPDFSASQPAGQPSVITLTDTSTGIDRDNLRMNLDALMA